MVNEGNNNNVTKAMMAVEGNEGDDKYGDGGQRQKRGC